MSMFNPDVDNQCQLGAFVVRTSGIVREEKGDAVYLHLSDPAAKGKGYEAPLTFRCSVSLHTLMTKPGDFVYIEWLGSECTKDEASNALIGHVRKFHLQRSVLPAYGAASYLKPEWLEEWRLHD